MPLSCADLREELSYIIKKLNNLGLRDDELKKLSCNLSNNDQVLVATHFSYKVKVVFKETVLDVSLGKTKYFAIHIEFQERGIPNVHSFIWIFIALLPTLSLMKNR